MPARALAGGTRGTAHAARRVAPGDDPRGGAGEREQAPAATTAGSTQSHQPTLRAGAGSDSGGRETASHDRG